MQTEYNGSMGLLEVKKVVLRNMGLNTVYEIIFTENDVILITSKLNVYLTDTNIAKKVSELISGDKIWVGISELYHKYNNYESS